MTRPAALDQLARLSATLGADLEQVQAAGGNSSIKLAGVLWVKASGLWLADALTRQIFVPVDLDRLQQGIASGVSDPAGPAVRPELGPSGLRPSIETTLHALLPHPVVLHTHSVRTIALAVRRDAEALLRPRLAGLRWLFIPYAHPGLPLTRAIAARLAKEPADVLILGNHGLVVGGQDVTSAAALLAEVERRLDISQRFVAPVQAPAPGALPADLGLRPVVHPVAQALAFDLLALPWVTAGSLYPDHVIFLGPGVTALPPGRDGLGALGEAVAAGRARGSRCFVQPGRAVYVDAAAGRSADELAACLALVAMRLPAAAEPCWLGADDEAALLNWDAEKYRQAVANERAPPSRVHPPRT